MKRRALFNSCNLCLFSILILGLSLFPVDALAPHSLITRFTAIDTIPEITHSPYGNYTYFTFDCTTELINQYSTSVRIRTSCSALIANYGEFDLENDALLATMDISACLTAVTDHTIASGINERNTSIRIIISPGHIDYVPYGNYTFWIDDYYLNIREAEEESLFFPYASTLIVNETGSFVYLGGANQTFEPTFRISSEFLYGTVFFVILLYAITIYRRKYHC